MTTLELIKAAMKDNDRIELRRSKGTSRIDVDIFRFEENAKEHTMFGCLLWMKDDIYRSFLKSTMFDASEEELFQTVADLYDGTVENFLEKVK